MKTRARFAAGITALIVSVPAIASAQSVTVQALLAQVAALQAQILALQSAATTTPQQSAPTSMNASPKHGVCPVLTQTLRAGSTGSDVANLQAFLSDQGVFKGIISGYFGPITEGAVREWQMMRGIVSSGDPGTTGAGVVGPQTRAAIAELCESAAEAPVPISTNGSCAPLPAPQAFCSSGWQPVANANGCTMSYTCVATSISSASSTIQTMMMCPTIPKPLCSGSVIPYTSDTNGCITAYQCVI